MLLAIDIGNTSISFGLFRRSGLPAANISPVKVFRIATDAKVGSLKKTVAKNAKKVDSIIICSVVPKKTKVLQELLGQLFKIKPKIIGKDIKVPIKNLYKNPYQVGADRLVNAYACKLLYGAPAIIIDFGTATTFDYLNKKCEYAGGIITPGIEISLDALYKKTALLPKAKMKSPQAFLGKNTTESIRSGVSFGLSCMCDGLITTFKKRYSGNIKVIATGGLAMFFKNRCKSINCVDKDLTLKGLNLIHKRSFGLLASGSSKISFR